MILKQIIDKLNHFGFVIKHDLIYIINGKYNNKDLDDYSLSLSVYELKTQKLVKEFSLEEEVFNSFLVSKFSIDIDSSQNAILFKSRYTNLNIFMNNEIINRIDVCNSSDNFFDSNIKITLDYKYVIISYEEKNFIEIFSLPNFIVLKRIYSSFNSVLDVPKIVLSSDNRYLAIYFNNSENTISYHHSEIIIMDLKSFEIIKTIDLLYFFVTDISFKENSSEILYSYTPYEKLFGGSKSSWAIEQYNFNLDKREILYKGYEEFNSFCYLKVINSIIISETNNGLYIINQDRVKTRIDINYNNYKDSVSISDNGKYLIYYDHSMIEIFLINYESE